MKEIKPYRSKAGPFSFDCAGPSAVYLGEGGGYIVSGFLVDRHTALEQKLIARKRLFLDVNRHDDRLGDYLIILEEM